MQQLQHVPHLKLLYAAFSSAYFPFIPLAALEVIPCYHSPSTFFVVFVQVLLFSILVP